MNSYLVIALALIGCGAILFLAELFVPTGGIAVSMGTALIVAAVLVVLYHGDTQEAVATVIAVSIGLPIGLYGVFYFWKAMTVIPGVDSESAVATLHELPENVEMERLKGRVGRTLTPMKPSGSIEIDGRRIDALSEGPMIDANQWVKCVGVKTGYIIVRQVTAPGDLADLKLDDLG